MTFESFFTKLVHDRLRLPRLLTLHDPHGLYRGIILGLQDDRTTVIDCGGDLLEAREKSLEALAALGEDTTSNRRLLLYVPWIRSLADSGELRADPFGAFIAAGAVFPDRAGDDYRQLCLQFLPEQAGFIESLFATGERPSIAVINSLVSGAVDSPVLKDLLNADGPKDMLVKFLTAAPQTIRNFKTTAHWLKDLKDLVARTLGLKLEGAKEDVEQLQQQLWRYLLFSEFATDLPVELPESLRLIPRAGKSQEPFVGSLCATLRDTGAAQQAYEDAATLVSDQLNLEGCCHGIEDFGSLDTFSFEERSFLRRFALELKGDNFESARMVVAQRRGSFWVEHDSRRSAEWQLADLAARLLMELDGLRIELAGKRTLDGWIAFYTESFAKVDSLHRTMEQVAAEISPVTPPLTEALLQSRETHQNACDLLARKFQQEVEAAGWPSATLPRSVDTFDRYVKPPWKAGERVAYFWVDALRYELAMALEANLATQHVIKLEKVCASMPCLTPIGMAALLPGADTLLEVVEDEGKPVARIGGKIIANPQDRAKLMADYLGGHRTQMVDLEDIAHGKFPENIATIEVLSVKTTDIDSLGENNPRYFIATIPSILRKIQTAVNHLAEAGFKRAIIATDHGFAWMSGASAGNAVAKPADGEWTINKDRVLLGTGSGNSTSLVMPAINAGIHTTLPSLAVPKGMATYTAGITYFHGGFSPQECILPVLDIKLGLAPKSTAQPVEINLTYRGANKGNITTLTPSLELAYPTADLFGPAAVRLILTAYNSDGDVVGEVATSAMVDSVSREINLERGKAIKVSLRIKEGFEGSLKVIASDPSTGTSFASITLKTEFHH
ncbi:MAG: PglZ domain-containing protein [Verrucomicrobiota bacterium]